MDPECRLEDLPRTMADRDRWWERRKRILVRFDDDDDDDDDTMIFSKMYWT